MSIIEPKSGRGHKNRPVVGVGAGVAGGVCGVVRAFQSQNHCHKRHYCVHHIINFHVCVLWISDVFCGLYSVFVDYILCCGLYSVFVH